MRNLLDLQPSQGSPIVTLNCNDIFSVDSVSEGTCQFYGDHDKSLEQRHRGVAFLTSINTSRIQRLISYLSVSTTLQSIIESHIMND